MDTTTKLKVGFAALMILSGIGVASYPVISNAVAQRHASEAIQNYDDTVKSMDTEKLDAAKEAAALRGTSFSAFVRECLIKELTDGR